MTIRLRLTALLILGLLQICDFLSTRLAVAMGGQELNPVVLHMGLIHAKWLALAICVLLVWKASRERTLWIAGMFYGCVVVWNLSLLAR